jgi:AcrR family transcriptional regulator
VARRRAFGAGTVSQVDERSRICGHVQPEAHGSPRTLAAMQPTRSRSRAVPVASTGTRRSATTRNPDARPRLSRDTIIETAIRIGSDNLEALSIRRLADELGVTPMALYRHVEDRDDIVVWVVDALLADLGLPKAPESDWKAWLAESARTFRRLLVGRPGVLAVYLAKPVTVPAALRRMERSLDVLARAGFTPEAAAQAYASVHTYTIGFAALEVSRARTRERARSSTASWRRYYAGLPEGEFPRVVSAATDLARFARLEQFERGLDQLIAGIAATGPRRGARRR